MSAASPETPARPALWPDAFVWAVSLLLFWPLTVWIWRRTAHSPQLLQSFVILAFAGAALALDRRDRLKPVFTFGPFAWRTLLAAYALMTAAILSRHPLPLFAAFAAALAAAALYLWGDRLARVVFSITTAFLAFLIIAALLPAFDWPLRLAAGSHAAWLLEKLGALADLRLVLAHPPKLMLTANTRTFEVAAECNGAGVISSSLLLALLLAAIRRVSVLDKILTLLAAGAAAFALNVVRIIAIALLAPVAGAHYLVMHEIVGTLLLFAALALVWWLATGLPEVAPRRRPPPSTAPTPVPAS